MSHNTPETNLASPPLFLLIRSEDNRYLIPIHEASEVSEHPGLKPLPVRKSGHLGVVNLHGEVVPLLSLKELLGEHDSKTPPSAARPLSRSTKLLVISIPNGSPVAIVCDSIRKIALQSSEIASGTVVNLDREPVQILTWDSIKVALGAS